MADLDNCFAALADPTRRRLIERLAQGGASVSELARPLPMSLPAVHKHLQVLERAGLVATRKHGRTRHVRLRGGPMAEAVDYLSRYRAFWEERLDNLAELLEGADHPEEET